MSGKLSSLSKRLAKLEQQIADRERREELANCTCIQPPDFTLANAVLPEQFEAEMNLPCPAHGFRRLGRIMQIRFVHPDGTREPSPRLDELIAIYEARLAEANRGHAHDPQET